MRAEGSGDIRRVTADEVKRALDAGEPVLLVDVRSPAAYADLHIAGAASVPARDVVARKHTLPRDHLLVFY